MLAYERIENIITKVKTDKKVIVSSLAKDLHVTEETIRRDLLKLENDDVVTRIHGGAILNETINQDIPYQIRNTINKDLKVKIASKLYPLINNKSTIVADTSSTVFEFLYKLKNMENTHTVITNSVDVMYSLRESNLNLISTGGSLRNKSFSLVGENTIETLKNYYFDYGIFSCKAISIMHGVMDSNQPEAVIKKVMGSQSKKVILLIDSTKFSQEAFVKVFDFKDIDMIITDKKPDLEWLEICEKNSIELIY